MSDAPGRLTLTFMIATAIISLSITVFALANAKLLDKAMVEPLISFAQSFGKIFAQSVGKPFATMLLFAIYSALFIVFSFQALFRPIFRPIHEHVIKRALDILNQDKRLESYRNKLDPVQKFDIEKRAREFLSRHKFRKQSGSDTPVEESHGISTAVRRAGEMTNHSLGSQTTPKLRNLTDSPTPGQLESGCVPHSTQLQRPATR